MKTFNINGHTIEFDDVEYYYEYFRNEDKIYSINFSGILTDIESGKMNVDEYLLKELFDTKDVAEYAKDWCPFCGKGYEIVDRDEFRLAYPSASEDIVNRVAWFCRSCQMFLDADKTLVK